MLNNSEKNILLVKETVELSKVIHLFSDKTTIKSFMWNKHVAILCVLINCAIVICQMETNVCLLTCIPLFFYLENF